MLRRIFFPGEQLLSPLAKNNDLVLLARGAVSIDIAGGVKVRNERPQSRKWGIWGMMRPDDERRSFFPLFRSCGYPGAASASVPLLVSFPVRGMSWNLNPPVPTQSFQNAATICLRACAQWDKCFFLVTGRTIRVERRGESLRGLSQREGMEMDMISPDDALHPAVASLQCTFWIILPFALVLFC